MWGNVKNHLILFGLSALIGTIFYFFGPTLAFAAESKIGMSLLGPMWLLCGSGGIAASYFFLADRLGVRQNLISAIICFLLIAAPQASYFLTCIDFFGNTVQTYHIVFPGIITGIFTLVTLLVN